MHKKFQAAIDSLNSVMDDHAEWENVSQRLAEAKAQLAAMTKELKEVGAKLADDRKLLEEHQHEALRKHEAAIFAKTKELKEVSDMVDKTRIEHADAAAKVKEARQAHDQVLSSMAVLRDKLA